LELKDFEILKKMNRLSAEELVYRSKIHKQLLGICEALEIFFWYSRSNENWLLKGDINTEYFHMMANGRIRKYTIF
jgi:hypothetical protein